MPQKKYESQKTSYKLENISATNVSGRIQERQKQREREKEGGKYIFLCVYNYMTNPWEKSTLEKSQKHGLAIHKR